MDRLIDRLHQSQSARADCIITPIPITLLRMLFFIHNRSLRKRFFFVHLTCCLLYQPLIVRPDLPTRHQPAAAALGLCTKYPECTRSSLRSSTASTTRRTRGRRARRRRRCSGWRWGCPSTAPPRPSSRLASAASVDLVVGRAAMKEVAAPRAIPEETPRAMIPTCRRPPPPTTTTTKRRRR